MDRFRKLFLGPIIRRMGTAIAVWIIAHLDLDANLEKQIFDWVTVGIAIAADVAMAYANRKAIIAESFPETFLGRGR